MGYFFFTQSIASNTNANILIVPGRGLFRDFMPALAACKCYEDPIKMKALSSRKHFPEYTYKSTAVLVAMETRVLIQSVPNAYAAFQLPQ